MNQVFSDKNQETQGTGQQTQASQMRQNIQEQNQRSQAPMSQMSQNMQGQNPQNQQPQRPQMGQGMQGQYVQTGQNVQGQPLQRPPMNQNLQGTYPSQAPQLQKSENQNFTAYQSMQRQEASPKTAEKPADKNGAGFFIRLAAYLIDALIVGAVLLLVGTPVWFMQLSMGDHAIFKDILFEYNIFDILKYLLVSAYFIVMTYTSERTVGKMLMKIRVKSELSEKLTFSQVVFREVIGKYLSGILYIGYIMIGISDKKKGLHDKLADTRVVYEVN